jgi:hypothetical protein
MPRLLGTPQGDLIGHLAAVGLAQQHGSVALDVVVNEEVLVHIGAELAQLDGSDTSQTRGSEMGSLSQPNGNRPRFSVTTAMSCSEAPCMRC